MQKKRRNIRTGIRVGGVEILFGLIFLLLPLAFELNDQIKKENTGILEYSRLIYDLKNPQSALNDIYDDLSSTWIPTDTSQIPILLKIDKDNTFRFYTDEDSNPIYKAYNIAELNKYLQNFSHDSTKRYFFEVKIHPDSEYQNFISFLNILYANPSLQLNYVTDTPYNTPQFFTKNLLQDLNRKVQKVEIPHPNLSDLQCFTFKCGTPFLNKELKEPSSAENLAEIIYELFGMQQVEKYYY